MNTPNMKIRKSGRLSFTIQCGDETAISATFVMQHTDGTLISDTVVYDTDGIAHFEFSSPDTDLVGEYEYQVEENFESGSPDIYPNFTDCDDEECSLPILEICESLPKEAP